MEDLSLHILDVVENSINAKATLIEIRVEEDIAKDLLILLIKDNGTGMSEDFLSKVDDPFTTTRTTRRVGLGIPLLKQSALESEGEFIIDSKKGAGTEITAKFKYSHIDRKPLGDIAATMITLLIGNPDIDFVFYLKYQEKTVEIDTREIKESLEGVKISHPSVIQAIKELF
jgi:hypothetical protein